MGNRMDSTIGGDVCAVTGDCANRIWQMTDFTHDVNIEWIKRAMRDIKYGEVILVIHDGQLVRVDTKERKTVK